MIRRAGGVRGIIRCLQPHRCGPPCTGAEFTIPERNRAIVREFREVIDGGFTGRDSIRRFPNRGKTIVFAVTKRHAETLAAMFDDHFADLKPRPSTRYADFVVQ